MRPFMTLLSALVSWRIAGGQFTPSGHSLHINDGNFSDRDLVKQEPFHALSGSDLQLKVQVSDVLSRQQLSQAVVEVYINYTRTAAALTGDDGGVLLHVPYQPGMLITIVASKDGYMCTLLPCKTNRMPIFSSMTIPLLGLSQGDIWLFEDSVLITGKTSGASSQPIVQFSKSLLNLTDSGNITSVRAYVTVPKLPSQDHDSLTTLGIMRSKSGYVSMQLTPVAAVSVQLFSGDTELHVSGPIHISLSIPDSCGLNIFNAVPAWFFNQTTGGWMRSGLGTVVSEKGKLLWTFTAPHLGYWLAAPLSSTRGFFELDIPIDFILHNSSLMMIILGGMLVIVICLLVGVLIYRRRSLGETASKKTLPVMRKDQTTSTCEDEYSRDTAHERDGLSLIERRDNRHNVSNVIANPSAVAIAVECNELALNDLNDLSEEIRVPASLTENLFFYNQPLAILHAPAFFHLEEQPEQLQRSKSLPRSGATSTTAAEPLSRDSFTQTLPKGPSATQNQAGETEDQLGVLGASQAAASSTSRGHFSFPESVSVPGTLSQIVGSRHSVHALAELSKIPSPQAPRAWFVSLEGKPAAEIRYTVSELQRRRRPVESRETSLDSGVDMSELSQISGRRVITLERNATFVKSTSSKDAPPQ